MGPDTQKVLAIHAIMKFALVLMSVIGLAAVAAAREKRSWISECLHDCDDLPRGQRAPCKADCFRTFDMDDCLLDCERYPPGAAQKNCQKHCIIFGSNEGSKKFKRDAECLHDCDDLPPGQRAPCRADCFRRNSQVKRSWITECLHDCDDLPQGHRAPCRADCMRGYKVKRSWISECLHDCEDL